PTRQRSTAGGRLPPSRRSRGSVIGREVGSHAFSSRFTMLLGGSAAPEQLGGGEQDDGKDNQARRDRRNGRIDLVPQRVEHAPRQGGGVAARYEQRHDNLVERGDEGEQRAGDHRE